MSLCVQKQGASQQDSLRLTRSHLIIEEIHSEDLHYQKQFKDLTKLILIKTYSTRKSTCKNHTRRSVFLLIRLRRCHPCSRIKAKSRYFLSTAHLTNVIDKVSLIEKWRIKFCNWARIQSKCRTDRRWASATPSAWDLARLVTLVQRQHGARKHIVPSILSTQLCKCDCTSTNSLKSSLSASNPICQI